ncbi:MAG: hypothetical protein QME63_00055 [Actinomycetota bacterium]|nr:hypothetical protein [Actinomycetota bacterium]
MQIAPHIVRVFKLSYPIPTLRPGAGHEMEVRIVMRHEEYEHGHEAHRHPAIENRLDEANEKLDRVMDQLKKIMDEIKALSEKKVA